MYCLTESKQKFKYQNSGNLQHWKVFIKMEEENNQENQKGIFLVNTISKIYENELNIPNENKNENMLHMQTAGRNGGQQQIT